MCGEGSRITPKLKTKPVVWTAAQRKKVLWRHTKNMCKGTLFECDEGIVWRVVESKSMYKGDEVVSYVKHFDNLEKDLSIDDCEYASYTDVRDWHRESRVRLSGSFSCF